MEGKEVFTTLSTFTRAINLKNDKKLLISDTVGFISKLPAYMIDAFKSTLQDITYSDLVLLVVDISQSIEEIKKKLDSSIHILLIRSFKVLYLFKRTYMKNFYHEVYTLVHIGMLSLPQQQILLIALKTGFNIEQSNDFMSLLVVPKVDKIKTEELLY